MACDSVYNLPSMKQIVSYLYSIALAANAWFDLVEQREGFVVHQGVAEEVGHVGQLIR